MMLGQLGRVVVGQDQDTIFAENWFCGFLNAADEEMILAETCFCQGPALSSGDALRVCVSGCNPCPTDFSFQFVTNKVVQMR